MTKTDYDTIQAQIILIANFTDSLRTGLSEARDMMDHTDSIAPMLDPSAWRLGHESMAILRRMADSLLKLAAARDELVALVTSQEGNPSWRALADALRSPGGAFSGSIG